MSHSQIEKVLDLLTHGVYIIGVKYGSKINGMTAAWVNQVSSQPPMVSVAIGKSHYTSELISKSKSFSVNILSPDQMELARKCGFNSGRDQDKLQEKEFTYQATRAPKNLHIKLPEPQFSVIAVLILIAHCPINLK